MVKFVPRVCDTTPQMTAGGGNQVVQPDMCKVKLHTLVEGFTMLA
jgi:hypothetical protein